MSIFNEGFVDTELFWLSFGDIISNVVIATVIIGEIGFVIWLLLKWLRGNIKLNWSPVLNIGESARRRSDSSIEKHKVASMLDNLPPTDMGPVEVDVKKNIFVGTADDSKLKTDEITRGNLVTKRFAYLCYTER